MLRNFSYLPRRLTHLVTSDIDILCSYLSPSASTPVRVSSFGSLSHFKKANKPVDAGAAKNCLDCPIQDDCTYSAKKSEYASGVLRFTKKFVYEMRSLS